MRRRATYTAYLHSRTWARVRGGALRRSRGHCMVCRAAIGIQVHHNKYPAKWGTERRDDVLTLCSGCHRLYERSGRLRMRGAA